MNAEIDKSRLAIHEASHLIAGDSLGWELDFVRIVPDGLCQWDYTAKQPSIDHLLVCRMAGMAGEQIVYDDARLHLADWNWALRVLSGEQPAKVRAIMGQAILAVQDILLDRWDEVAVLTDCLINAERLTGPQARQLLLQARGRR